MAIETVCICGAGTMGSGIAQVVAMHGYTTILFDVSEKVLENSNQLIKSNLEKLKRKAQLSEKGVGEVLQRIKFTTSLDNFSADIFIEAIIENEEAKKKLFKSIAALNATNTILATNTSSLSVSILAASVPNPERVVGMHFFNPAYAMKLVEVVKAKQTDERVMTTVLQLAKNLGKVPVVCKDAPGFIVNRVARQYYLEALHLVETGVADTNTVDEMMEACGFKMGPFALMDLIGLDINFAATSSIYKALGQPVRLTPSNLQEQKVINGELGRKTAKGFYTYQSNPPSTISH